MSAGFIHFYERNGREYAEFCIPKRTGGKKTNDVTYLGTVVDKEKGVFKSRQRGVFRFSVQEGFGEYTGGEAVSAPLPRGRDMRSTLTFGDSFFLFSFIRTTPCYPVLATLFADKADTDTLFSLIGYYMLSGGAREYARIWWEGNYACQLFPEADLDGRRISEFLGRLGDEDIQRRFFKAYLSALVDGPGIHGILIDSTGLPNSVGIDTTEISNHNGRISLETRLVYVTERNTGMPLFFRYIAGNIIDVSTLRATIAELEQLGLATDFTILDAGYYTKENISLLHEQGIAYITRLKPNLRLYKQLMEKHLDTIERPENLVTYNKRAVYVKRVPCSVDSRHGAFAYICMDLMMRHARMNEHLVAAMDDGQSAEEALNSARSLGLFMLVSSEELDPEEVLPLYYTRQQIEQVFDISKNYADILPLRVHSEQTFRGHLFISFVATIICHRLQKLMKGTGTNQAEAFRLLANQRCRVYENVLITDIAKKRQNDLYKLINIKPPVSIPRVL